MFEKYTERARRVLFFARFEASQLGSVDINSDHLMLGLLRDRKGLTHQLFAGSQVSTEDLRKETEGRTFLDASLAVLLQISRATGEEGSQNRYAHPHCLRSRVRSGVPLITDTGEQ